MSLWDFARDPGSVRMLLDFGAEHGVPADVLLAKSGIAPEVIGDPNGQLSAMQELKVIENLMRALNRPAGLGMRVGLRCNFSAFGMWGYGLISSATLGDAVNMALRFLPLTFAYSVIEQSRVGDQAMLTFGPPQLAPGTQRFVVEREMGAAICLLQEVGGRDFALSSLTLLGGKGRQHAAPEGLTHIAGVTPDYRGDGYRLTFDAQHLHKRLPTANATTAAMCEQMCVKLIDQRKARIGTAKVIEGYLSGSQSPTLPTLDQFARLTHTSERTLKRRLQKEGTSFRELVTQQRSATAAEWVSEGRLSLTEIALRLGYSDLSCFSQAFKRWFGMSPAAWRKQHHRSSTSQVCTGW